MSNNSSNSPLYGLRRMAAALAGAVAVAVMALFTGCGSDDNPSTPTDPSFASPYTITMRVLDPTGQNLLNPKVQNNILKDSVTLEFAGESFQLDTIPSEKTMPEGIAKDDNTAFYGLWLYTPVGTSNYILQFGEFAPKVALEDQQLVINWNDGSKRDTVSFSHTPSATGDGTFSTSVWLNKKPATMPITFVRER